MSARARRERDALAIGAFFVAIAALALLLFASESRRHITTDFASFYFAGQAVQQHANPYDVQVLKALGARAGYQGEVFPYLYPPFVCAIVMRPFVALSYGSALAVWFWCNFACVLAGMFLLARSAARSSAATHDSRRRYLWLSAGAAIVLLFHPFADNFRWAQINPLIFLGLVLVVHFLSTGRDVPAAAVLAPIILIKIAPAFLLLYLILTKRYRAAVATASFVVVLLAISIFIAGVDHTTFYVDNVLGGMSFGKPVPQLPDEIAGYPGNHSLNGLLSSLFVESMLGDRLPWRSPQLGGALYYVLCLGLVVDLALRVRRTAAENGSVRQLLQISSVILVYTLISSITSEHHLISLAIPIVALGAFILQMRPPARFLILVGSATAVLAIDAEAWYFTPLFRYYAAHAEFFDGHPLRQYAFLLVLPIKTYALVALWSSVRMAEQRLPEVRVRMPISATRLRRTRSA